MLQHIFIPVLPSSLLSFCCAPMPFLVGVLRSSMRDLVKMSDSMESEVVIFDIDNNKFLSKRTVEDYQLVPSSYTAPLITSLNNTIKNIKVQSSVRGLFKTQVAIKDTFRQLMNEQWNAFTTFFTTIMDQYRNFMFIAETNNNASSSSSSAPSSSSSTSTSTSSSEQPRPNFDRDGFIDVQPEEIRAVRSKNRQDKFYC